MSEYQYYEWQTLERPLTAAEQNAVDALSSHIDVTSSQAIVTYNWGDFKHDPLDVLAKYFDAYLYLANWGTRRLAFRFPKGLLDAAAIDAAYCDEDYLHIKTVGNVHILEFELNIDEGFDEWIEERGLLSTLARLRDDIIQSDYCALYIVWLKAMSERSEYYDEDDPENFFNDPEPPLPAGLKKLTPPLEVLIDFLEIDPFLVAAAAERSPNLLPLKGQDFAPLISRLTRQECDDFLLKIVHAEPGAVAALRKRLLSVEQPKPTAQTAPRTIGELLEIAENLGEAEVHRQIEEKRKKHIVAMQKLAKREMQIWQDVERTLESGYSAANYDHATALLDQLHQLAEFQGTPAKFDTRVDAFAEQYSSRSALLRRWKKNGWV